MFLPGLSLSCFCIYFGLCARYFFSTQPRHLELKASCNDYQPATNSSHSLFQCITCSHAPPSLFMIMTSCSACVKEKFWNTFPQDFCTDLTHVFMKRGYFFTCLGTLFSPHAWLSVGTQPLLVLLLAVLLLSCTGTAYNTVHTYFTEGGGTWYCISQLYNYPSRHACAILQRAVCNSTMHPEDGPVRSHFKVFKVF